jgi:pyruvate/2-oxoglutarate dehydrogenase complex dihydrolipoamide acyltransferase (E2) component
MATQILMPALSPTMTEGTLAKWLKKEGDTIKAGDVIAEIETDKATMEVEAVDEGVLGKILVEDGTANVKVNAPIAVLVDAGEAVPAQAPASAPQASAPPTPTGCCAPGLRATTFGESGVSTARRCKTRRTAG